MKSNLKSWIPFQRKHFGYKSSSEEGKPCTTGHNAKRDGCIPTKKEEASKTESPSGKIKENNKKPRKEWEIFQGQYANQIQKHHGNPMTSFGPAELVPINEVKPNQFGEDYDNSSSRELARKIKEDGTSDRQQDNYPIAIDEDGNIIDGNHRHAAATMNNATHIWAIRAKGNGNKMKSGPDDKPKQDVRGKPCPPGYNKERDGCIPTDGNGESTNETDSNELERTRNVGRGPAGQDDIGRSDTGRDEGIERELGGFNSPSVGGTPKTGKIRPQEERIITARAAFTHPADTSIIPEDLRGHLKDHQQQAVAKAKLAMDKYGGFILADGCVAAGTRIYNPITNEHVPIEELVEHGKPHAVLSITKDGLKPCMAFSPFLKGKAKLYRVTFDDGRNITVTDQHRFLSPSSWLTLADGLSVGCFLACVEGLPASGLGFVPSTHNEDAPHWMKKAEDCLDGYLQDSYLCDEQLPQVADTDREFFPSQDDVHEHNSFLHKDVLDSILEHKLHHSDDRLSMNRSYPQEILYPLSNGCRISVNDVPQSADSHLIHSPFQKDLVGPPSSFAECFYLNECVGNQNEFVSECSDVLSIVGYDILKPETYLQSHQSSNLLNKDSKHVSTNVQEQGECVATLECSPVVKNQSNYYSRWNRVVSIEFVKEDNFYDMYVPGSENYVAEGIINHNTGAGKTRVQLATAKMYADQGKKVVIISKSEVIKPSWDKNQFGGSFLEDGQTMGIDMQLTRGLEPLENGNIYLSTFGNLEALSEIVDKDTIVLYDESHSIKNYGTARGIAGNLISDKAGAVMYASATPLDKPLQVAYLFRARLFGDRPWDETRQALGFIKKTHKYGGKKVTTWDINPSVGTAECMRRLSGLFDKMTEEGLMLKREISYEGVDINFSTVKMPPQVHDTMDRIAEAVASLDLPGMVKKGLTLQHQRRQQEAFKVPVTADNAIKELNEGRSVVIFCTRRNKSEVLDYEGNVAAYSDSTIKLMREELEKRGIDPSLITELHGGQSKKANRKSMADFQSNKAKIIIATIDSGGTGINLDDRGGNNPRTLLMMTPPYSGMDNVQAAGRVWRMSTKSAPRIKYIIGNTDVDYWNASIVGKKMQILGATVSGEIGRLDPTVQMEGEDAIDEIMQKESDTPYKWPISLTNAIPDNYNPTTQLGAPDKVYHKLNAKNSTTVGGFTKEHEQVILEQGGQWDLKNNVWYVPHHKAEALKNLPGIVLTGRKKKKVKVPKVKISPIKKPKHLKGMHISKVEMPDGKTQRTHTFLPGENSDFWKLWNSPDRPKYLSIGMNQDGKWEASVWGDSRDDVISGIADLMKRNIYTPPSKGGKPAAASSNEKPDKPTSENRPKKVVLGAPDTFGNRAGTRAAKINSVLTDKPKTLREITEESGASAVSSHLATLMRLGKIVREGRGYRLKRKNEKNLWRPFSKHLLFQKKNWKCLDEKGYGDATKTGT